MKYQLEKINNDVIFSFEEGSYELKSHPYEPCLYICKNNEMIKILHNAFEAHDLIKAFEAGEKVTAPDGTQYDKDSFCRVLIAALSDERHEMNFTFAARLAE